MPPDNAAALSRRQFVRDCALGVAALACAPAAPSTAGSAPAAGAADRVLLLDSDWLFGGKLTPGALDPGFDDSAFARICLPHVATSLSWRNWPWEEWQDVWCYRRHVSLPDSFRDRRVFLDFDGVMVGAKPAVNGHVLPKHLGGYLPFHYEITDWVKSGDNLLAVAIDSRWSNVPPQGSPLGPRRVDYLEPGGIHRPVRLRAVPRTFISDVFVRAADVLDPGRRRLDVSCTIDAAAVPDRPAELVVELRDGGRLAASGRRPIRLEGPGVSEAAVTLSGLRGMAPWDVNAPHLYDVTATLVVGGNPAHARRVRTGFREARFEQDGFYLNGRRLQIFGLNRHELYPYTGYAMPPRAKRRDAQILKHDLNVNFVRCSHYPQSAEFLDACDDLGLLVWEEVPGWGYIGDDAWKDLLVRDARDMILRDRNRPSIVVWGTRANESANDEDLYRRTRAVARALDPTRPTSGSMTSGSRKTWERDWHEDVFAYDDYHAAPDRTVGIDDPVPGVPYVLAEAVGQFNYATGKGFDSFYRRAGDAATQQLQALRHAQAHSRAAANPRICGLVAWCGFEYGSLVNARDRVKHPGVCDIFRIPKLGASFYLAQGDPGVRPVIAPNFYWDFGPRTPRGPGGHAAIFSNCDRLDVFIDGRHHASLRPDSAGHPHLRHPPFFVDLDLDGGSRPELRIDGFLGGRRVLTRAFASDPTHDRLALRADDGELIADGVDATRLVFQVTDRHGAPRAFAGGKVVLELAGPGTIVGDNPFDLEPAGGAGAVWVRSLPRSPGRIVVRARHERLGGGRVEIGVRPA